MPAKSHRSTTSEGYGWDHQQQRRKLIAALQDGDPCARCRGPMYRAEAHTLHADHVHTSKALGQLADALSHGSCNMSEGARTGNAMRAARHHDTEHQSQHHITRPRTSREW